MAPRPLAPPLINVGFDATALLGRRTGVGVFADEVLRGLSALPTLRIQAYALTWRGRQPLESVLPVGVGLARLRLPARALRALWRHGIDFPYAELICGQIDVVHGPNFVVPPTRRAARIVTVHDLTPVLYPQYCTQDTLAYPGLIERAVARGAWVHTPSEQIATEVKSWLNVTERVVTIPNGVHNLAGDALRGRASAGCDTYVLALGTIEPRKNLTTLVAAFDAAAREVPELHLVVAGAPGWGSEQFAAAVAAARHRDRIHPLGWVSPLDRADLLAGARIFAYPSAYEGFGLPPLEAMAAGIPTVTSDARALLEVTGDAARHVRVGAIEELAAELCRLHTDELERARLIRAGRIRAERYPWSATVDGLGQLYETAYAAAR